MYAAVTRARVAVPLTEEEYRRVQAGGEQIVAVFAKAPGFQAYYAMAAVGSNELTTIHVFGTKTQWLEAIRDYEPAALTLLGPDTVFEHVFRRCPGGCEAISGGCGPASHLGRAAATRRVGGEFGTLRLEQGQGLLCPVAQIVGQGGIGRGLVEHGLGQAEQPVRSAQRSLTGRGNGAGRLQHTSLGPGYRGAPGVLAPSTTNRHVQPPENNDVDIL